jgi:uncharacterized protein (DUF58 family)
MKPIRTRTRLGPSGKVFIVVASLLIVMAVYTQFNLLIVLFGLMVGGLICSLVHSWLTMRNLTVHRILPAHGVMGEAMIIRYRITNANRRVATFALHVEDCGQRHRRRRRDRAAGADPTPHPVKGPQGWVVHVGPQQTVQCEAKCWPTRRGALQFDVIRLETSFPFGVIRRIAEFAQEGRALVYPRLVRINRRLLHELSFMDSTGSRLPHRGGGYDETFGLRKYREGDSLKIIDWKHTAKTGQLICRDLTWPRAPRIMLGLELTHGDGATGDTVASADDVECAVSLAASIVCDAYLRGYQIGLTVSGAACDWFPTHHSLPHRTRLLEALATLDVNGPSRPVARHPVSPTVIIRAGTGGARVAGDPLVLGVAEMDRYVDDIDAGSARILDDRPQPVQRRELLQADPARS